jgi:hypothetical protein
MSARLEILKKSLVKKNDMLSAKFDIHFQTVAEANGQPLNDKRNGRATLNKWERQNDSIRAAQDSIEITKIAIEKENSKIAAVAAQLVPNCIKSLIDNGTLNQWRKRPNRFFVAGVDKARIIYDDKTNKITCSHISGLAPDQFAKFRDVFNSLKKELENN